MGKYDKLLEKKKDFIEKSEMKSNNKNNEFAQVHIYNVPKLWIEQIKKQGMTVSQFFKMAAREKLNKENLL